MDFTLVGIIACVRSKHDSKALSSYDNNNNDKSNNKSNSDNNKSNCNNNNN